MSRFVRFRTPHRVLVLLLLFLALTLPAPAAAAVPTFGARTLDVAARYSGVPYKWGGTTPRGFDCSGYTRYVYARLGKKIPRTSRAQFDRSRKVGKRVRVGDLVFFRSAGGRVYHVGIYAGDHRIWHAPRPGKRVKLEQIWTARWTGGRY